MTRAPLSWAFALAVFLVLQVIASFVLGEITCSDGWASGSIGKQGACSHHSGVDGSVGLFIFLMAITAGCSFYASSLSRHFDEKQPKISKRSNVRDLIVPPILLDVATIEVGPTQNTLPPQIRQRKAFGSTVHKCPKCGLGMVKRKSRTGYHRGKYFWGCSGFPDCKGVKQVTSRKKSC